MAHFVISTPGPIVSNSIVAYIDGGARGNPGPAGYGVRVEDPDGTLVEEFHASIGIATNNAAEYRALIANEVYVTMVYAGMLRREPDSGGFAYWVGYMDAGNAGLALIGQFLGAPEYRGRFLP